MNKKDSFVVSTVVERMQRTRLDLQREEKKVRHDSSRIGGQATPGEADY